VRAASLATPTTGTRWRRNWSRPATLLQDIGAKPNTAIVDLGYRGVDADCVPVQIIHRGKYKTLTATQRSWLKRRQAIEPAIGHAKADHRMDRCWLKGSEGDALHAVLCAAGFNIRWLLRAIARQAAKAASLVFNLVALYAALAMLAVLRVLLTATTPGPIGHPA
jgi:IS5 family transposase